MNKLNKVLPDPERCVDTKIESMIVDFGICDLHGFLIGGKIVESSSGKGVRKPPIQFFVADKVSGEE